MPKATKDQKIEQLLMRAVDTVIERDHLEKALRGSKKLRVKHGIDPTGKFIHIGRAMVLWKLREFQELGHKVIIIIGDFTAQIGDPSDKLEKRPFLTEAQVKENLKNYLAQIGKIVDLKKAEVKYNSAWLRKLNFREISQLAETFSVQQMIERENFKQRWDKHQEISLREFMYPLMQGYDSVAIEADIELGGTDQLFNIMAGRTIQKFYGQKPQDVMTMKMLYGLDGRKMSTSWGNVINTIDSPDEQYGKLMSMHDEQIIPYFEFATDVPLEKIGEYKTALTAGENPKTLKEKLAFEIVQRYHGTKNAELAAKKFETVFTKKDITGTTEYVSWKSLGFKNGTELAKIVAKIGQVKKLSSCDSTSKAWRIITQGGVDIDGVPHKDPKEKPAFDDLKGKVMRIGKHSIFRFKE